MLWSRLSKKLKTKTRHFRALCTSTAKGSLLLRFSDWMRWRARLIAERQKLRERQQQVVKVCMQLVSHGTLRYWFAILAKNRVHKREKRVRDHLAQAFAKQTTESRKQSVFDTWKTYLQRHKVQLQKKALTTTFLSSTCNGLRQVYFDKLSGFLKHRRNMKKSNALMTTLRMLTQQGSKGEIFQRWKAVALRQRELAKKAAVAAAIANRMPDVCRRTYYAKWRVFAGGRKTTRARVLLDRSRRLELAMTARQKERKLLKACYRLWSEFQQKRSVERQGASTAENFSNLQQKTEALWYQLELHQKTVSNTNTCVQRLVDKIITVEDSVDRLDKTKASRRELQAYIDTNVVTAPVLLDDEVNPADDLVSSQTTIHGPADSHKHELSSLLPLGSADLHRGASSQFAASVHHRPTHRPPSPIYAIREASTHSRLPVHRHPSDPPQPTYPNLRSTYPPEHRR
ncbi:hypothetical protein DIPPA_17038 [Diplonema papillatum]|nr:hypothetical protein DIPPA_17038 [Diplonema papillatum]